MPLRSGRCVHCRCLFVLNPRLKDQRYCGRIECQRARKRHWQRTKMAADADYQLNLRLRIRSCHRIIVHEAFLAGAS